MLAGGDEGQRSLHWQIARHGQAGCGDNSGRGGRSLWWLADCAVVVEWTAVDGPANCDGGQRVE